jgi:hypothetical protein
LVIFGNHFCLAWHSVKNRFLCFSTAILGSFSLHHGAFQVPGVFCYASIIPLLGVRPCVFPIYGCVCCAVLSPSFGFLDDLIMIRLSRGQSRVASPALRFLPLCCSGSDWILPMLYFLRFTSQATTLSASPGIWSNQGCAHARSWANSLPHCPSGPEQAIPRYRRSFSSSTSSKSKGWERAQMDVT